MELRSYNVECIYKECVKCRIGDEIGVDAEKLNKHKDDIIDMVHQVARYKGWSILASCNIRKDSEVWTPYMQIVEMLVLLGEKAGVVSFARPLESLTIINFI